MKTNEVGIAILERQFEETFKHLVVSFDSNKIILKLDNHYDNNLIRLFFKRRLVARELYSQVMAHRVLIQKLDKIILSSSEGFIAKNFIYWIRKLNPSLIIVSLQHGKFHLVPKLNSLMRDCLNFVTLKTSSFYMFGSGFYEKEINEFVVSNTQYKETLINQCNFSPEKIFVAASFLKSPDTVRLLGSVKDNASEVIFLMQPLAKTGYCTEIIQDEILDCVMDYLAKNHENFIIKQHPFYQSEYLNINFQNKIYHGSLAKIAPSIKFVYSFFSEGLQELEHKDRNCIAIKHCSIDVRPEIYSDFSQVLNLGDGLAEPRILTNRISDNYLEDVDEYVVFKKYLVNASL